MCAIPAPPSSIRGTTTERRSPSHDDVSFAANRGGCADTAHAGRPDMAQGGGPNGASAEEALDAIERAIVA